MPLSGDDNTQARRGQRPAESDDALHHGGRRGRARGWPVSADVAGAAGGERVADPQAHGRADRQGGDVAGGEPAGVAGLDLVTGRAAAQRAGVEADRERLADQPGPRVGDDVAGVTSRFWVQTPREGRLSYQLRYGPSL
jgi:hypothetical protein